MTDERFQEYVDEFRAFSRFHKVGCGHPHDLLILMITVRGSEGFRSELSSMIRSVLYRESEGVTQPDLLRLVAVAWGGGEGTQPLPEMKPMMAELEVFLHDLLSRPTVEPMAEIDGEVMPEEIAPVPEVVAAAKPRTDSGEISTKRDPWADGSALHQELMKFKAWSEAK